MPSLPAQTTDLPEYVDIGATTPLLVHGPYLVRTAAIEGDTLSLTGDSDETTVITVWAPGSITQIKWNGESVWTEPEGDALVGSIAGVETSWTLPDLNSLEWYYADSLPEILPSFDDSSLVPADHTNTTNSFAPYYGGPWVLYADDCTSFLSLPH